MKTRFVIFLILLPLIILAKKTYDPWYTGPLIATTANNVYKGQINIQPYFYYTNTYGRYSNSWKYHSTLDIFTFQGEIYFKAGLTKWLDLTIIPRAFYNKNNSKDSFNFGDFPIALGFQIIREKELTPIPSIRFFFKESFPTGKYNNLNPNKTHIESTGSGSYETSLNLFLGKTVYWITNHPIAWRLNLIYTYPSNVKVKNFNTYGGGFNTDGKVKPGQKLSSIIAFEFSFTQRWVYAMDIEYIHITKTTFNGISGNLENGSIASNTKPSSDQLSLAPAIEYNFNKNLGAIGGMQFTIAGRNSKAFYSGIISVTYTF